MSRGRKQGKQSALRVEPSVCASAVSTSSRAGELTVMSEALGREDTGSEYSVRLFAIVIEKS